MATFWIDLKNGNDANAGTYAAPWLTFANGPTAARIAPGDEIRLIRTAKSTLANTTWTNNSSTVTIPSGTILDIDTAIGNTWTMSANVTGQTSSTRKLGATCQSFNVASAFTSGKIAYKNVGTLDLSAYSKFSFYFSSGGSTIAANTVSVSLCSDTTGDTPVHTVNIPAISGTSIYAVTFDNGGPLSSSINSVRVSVSVDPTTVAWAINNIIAHNDLGLGCLVGPSDSESFYPVQSITGTTLTLDRSNAINATGSVWLGTTGTYTMTIRDSIFSQSATISPSEGAISGDYYVSGGWQNETTQDGYTLMRYSPFSINQNGWNYENIGVLFTSVAISFGAASVNLKNIVCSNNTTAISYSTGGQIRRWKGFRFYSNGNGGLSASSGLVTFEDFHYVNNNSSITLPNGSAILNSVFKAPATSFFANTTAGIITTRNCEIAGTVIPTYSQWHFGMIVEENTIGSSYPVNINFGFGVMRWQTSVKQGSDPGAWEISSITSSRPRNMPFEYKIAEILCTSGVTKTVSVWMMKTHATDVGISFFVEGGRLTGVNETETTKDNDTNWQQVGITITPTETGVIGFFIKAWYVNASANMYIGSLTVS